VAAVLIFTGVLALAFADVWRADPRATVPLGRLEPAYEPLARADVSFEAWLVSRHARTLVREPWRLFDTEHCAPGEKTLTLSLPMLTMSLLAVPAGLLGEPILTYNAGILALVLVSALAMYLLASDWTGSPPAGIVAGLLFAFGEFRIASILHPSEADLAWTVFALYFARRLLANGRWRDAVGLAAAGALQIAASFYPLLAAFFLAPPLALWLVLAYGVRRVRPTQLAFVAVAVALAAALVLGPYLERRGANPGHLQRGVYFYAPWVDYLPGRGLFPGWVLPCLAALGLALPRRLGFAELARDPRLALFASALVVAIVAGGPLGATVLAPFGFGEGTPNPYQILAAFLPGLDTVRGVVMLTVGVGLVLSLLAAAGVAGCCRAAGRFSTPVAVALIGLAAYVALPTRAALVEDARPFLVANIRPRPELLDFFAALEAQGNRGPILELPFEERSVSWMSPGRILVGAWHHRRTTACYGSYALPEYERMAALVASLPDPRAVRELAELGFTTIVIHDPKGWFGAQERGRIARGTGRRFARLRPLLETEVASAFAIEVGPEPARERAPRDPAQGT
jgi:hypothetical protein